MNELFRQNTKLKIIIAFGVLLLVMCGIQYFSSVSINGLIENEKEYHKNVMALSENESIKATILDMQVYLKKFYTTSEINNLKITNDHLADLQDDNNSLGENLSDPAQIEFAKKLHLSVTDFIAFVQKISTLAANKDTVATKNCFEAYYIEKKVAIIESLCDKIDANQDKLM